MQNGKGSRKLYVYSWTEKPEKKRKLCENNDDFPAGVGCCRFGGELGGFRAGICGFLFAGFAAAATANPAAAAGSGCRAGPA